MNQSSDDILSSEPFASSTPSLNTTIETPHAFHPFASNTTSHTSHRFQPYTTSANSSSSLSHRHTTPHTASSTPATSSTSANSSFNTYNTLLLQLFAIHSLTSTYIHIHKGNLYTANNTEIRVTMQLQSVETSESSDVFEM